MVLFILMIIVYHWQLIVLSLTNGVLIIGRTEPMILDGGGYE